MIGVDDPCERILSNLHRVEVIVPDQIREELERNLLDYDMRSSNHFVLQFGVIIDFARVPASFVATFEVKGPKKGDAEIGAFCEWRNIPVILSGNRDSLRGLSADHSFQVLSPMRFFELLGIASIP